MLITFTINKSFYKQTDGCSMSGPLFVTSSDINMIKVENDITLPTKPVFYCRFVDDIYDRRKKNTEDKLYHSLNNYHKNIKLTIEVSATKFLDTHLFNQMETWNIHHSSTQKRTQNTNTLVIMHPQKI